MKSRFDLWVDACDKCGDKLFLLEGKNDTGLYEIQRDFTSGNHTFHEVAYAVWVNGEPVAFLAGYLPALQLYQTRAKQINIFQNQEETTP